MGEQGSTNLDGSVVSSAIQEGVQEWFKCLNTSKYPTDRFKIMNYNKVMFAVFHFES